MLELRHHDVKGCPAQPELAMMRPTKGIP
jgi:hypothetical protein